MGAQLLVTLQGHLGRVLCLAVSVDGRFVYSGDGEGCIRGWRSEEQQVGPRTKEGEESGRKMGRRQPE